VSWVRRAEDYPYFDNGGRPIGFAHRGGALTGANVGLENSMVAFESAVDLGYRYLETDVHATSDGALLAFHDRTLDRVTDRSGVVSQLRYDEVKRALIDGREPIPLLSEILERWPDVRVNVDAKADNTVWPLVDVVNRQRAWDRVCVASFSPSRLHRLRSRLGPRVATSLATVGVGALRLLPGGLPRRLALGSAGQAAQVPVRRGRLEIVTAQFVQRAHRLGKQVHVWTIDDPAEMERLLDLGVDAVITDRTDLLREVYRRRGIWTA
jgi:glycerophosphoryl diester phosphodiesterase